VRQTWIGTGWKMNKTLSEATSYAQTLRQFVKSKEPSVQVFVVPPFTALCKVGEVLNDTPVLVGAQNMHWEEWGAFTGEISPLMIRDCGARLVELGHSERRAEFGETDFTVNRKVLSALRHQLRPLVCVGETAVEKQAGVTRECVARQVKLALKDVPKDRVKEVLFAYEPVWAIGEGGTPADPEYANAVQGFIREAAADLYGPDGAADLTVLYGGSVNTVNAAALAKQPNVDGLFIGRAAWEAASFIHLIELVEKGIGSARKS
jgi:triosephosphate isomerase